MKIKALLATLIGAVAFQGATAGDVWCPPAKDKCPVECCEDTNGSVSVGYMSDYIFYGVRMARDSVWADANYTFDLPCVGLPLTVGVWHLTSLGSGALGNDNYGDETDLYASLGLPSICGFDMSLGYTHYLYPTQRIPNNAKTGDSQSEINFEISREIYCGVTLAYRAAYDFTMPSARRPFPNVGGNALGNSNDNGAWVHTLGLTKSLDITDCLALDLSGGVLYTDNYWTNLANSAAPGNAYRSGWNNYYLQAAMPIALSGCATLTPYLGYSGTPDGWVGDGLNGGFISGNPNKNDVFHGGVSISVGF